MPRKTKKPAGPPPDASLLGIPPELRNAIYHLVADDIDEASIIGRKLKSNVAWWDAMAKHPLSQTCRQLRQEFDSIHRRRAMRVEIIDELIDDAKVELDRQIQEGLESWSNGAGAESTYQNQAEGRSP